MHMATSQAPLIELDGVVRRYAGGDHISTTALDRVSFAVAQTETVALVGPSGSGKSTLLHLIGGFDRPDDGLVRVGGSDVASLRGESLAAHRRRVGFVFQRFYLLPALTTLDNVIAPVLPLRVGFDKRARARELLAAVGLSDRERSLPAKLSGGEQQRVAIARALINRPPVVLADEPTGNLDTVTGAAIMDLLLGLREASGITLLVATHDVSVASRCDRVIRIVDGRVRDDIDVQAATDPQSTLARLSRVAPR
jgi:putative ABC transport system ATP-binding protein